MANQDNNDKLVLVTGGSGFCKSLQAQLLQQGHSIKTTLRSLQKKKEVLDMMPYAIGRSR